MRFYQIGKGHILLCSFQCMNTCFCIGFILLVEGKMNKTQRDLFFWKQKTHYPMRLTRITKQLLAGFPIHDNIDDYFIWLSIISNNSTTIAISHQISQRSLTTCFENFSKVWRKLSPYFPNLDSLLLALLRCRQL